ncbi:MAG: glycosyltransferase, partial [Cyanobacteria bacterium HKST-UBA06]|nr:glycosyltransferase [Cyanobacteria bacterium HKST-UBA06]
MTTLTLAMIVRDEEMTMDRVLTCASSFCDEIVVVDTGSTDQTIPIIQAFAQRHPNIRVKIDHFEWINDFSAARNYAFSLSTSVWTMWLDADDILHA